MLTFKLTENNSFEFTMQISGDAAGEPETMFVFKDGARRHCFEAKHHGQGQYSVIIPEMKGVIKTGEYQGEIWVVLNDKIFKPISETIKFEEEVKPVISNMKESLVSVARPTFEITKLSTSVPIVEIPAVPSVPEPPARKLSAEDLKLAAKLFKRKES